MKLIFAIIYVILFAPTQQSAPACVVSGADIPAALVEAQAGSRCLHIPSGTYDVSVGAGSWLNVTADNMLIYGDGPSTVLRVTSAITQTGTLYVLSLSGQRQTVRDLSIRADGTATSGIKIVTPGTGAHVSNVDISGQFSAAGLELYQPWNVQGGAQSSIVEDSYIHDMPGNGFIVNSSRNIISHNRIERVGISSLFHGMYLQGGYNLIDGNTIVEAKGFSLHAYKQVPNIDASGDRYIGNTSIDPGVGHVIVQGLPNGASRLTRYTTITGNLFRNTGGRQSSGVTLNDQAILTSNQFEDIANTNGDTIKVGGSAAGSIITGNRIATSVRSGYAVSVGVPATIADNVIEGLYGTGITVNGSGVMVRSNRLTLAGIAGVQGANGIGVGTTNVILDSNIVNVTGPGVCIVPGALATFRANILEPRGGAWTYTVNGGNWTGVQGSDVIR